jgi:hypothetical protein
MDRLGESFMHKVRVHDAAPDPVSVEFVLAGQLSKWPLSYQGHKSAAFGGLESQSSVIEVGVVMTRVRF